MPKVEISSERKKIIAGGGLSFILPVLVCIFSYYINGIYPGGKTTLLIYDMSHQYVSFFSSLKDIFSGENSFFYSFSQALGGDYLGLFGYYLSSPLNIIFLFVDLLQLPDAIYFLTIIKVGLVGLSFYIYVCLSRRYEGRGLMPRLIFSCCYALSGYVAAYSVSIMWLEGVIMLPLVILALERYIDEKKRTAFLLAMTAAFILNYYTGFMIALFSLLYFFYYEISKGEDIKAILKGFAGFCLSGINAALLSAPLLLPSFLQLLNGKLTHQYVWRNELVAVQLKDIFVHFLSMNYVCLADEVEQVPLYCGTLTIACLLLFFIDRKRVLREKIAALALLIIFFLSMWLRPLYRIWHCFGDPVCFPGRFGFVVIFFILSLAALVPYDEWLKGNYRLVFFMAAAYLFIELFLNYGYVISKNEAELHYQSRIAYANDVEKVTELLKGMEADGSFYRLVRDCTYTSNDGMLYGYKGVGYFSSSYDANIMNFLGTLGMCHEEHDMGEEGSTPFLDLVLGIRYRLEEYRYPDKYYEKLEENGRTALLENKAFSGIGFLAEGETGDISGAENSFEALNMLAASIAPQAGPLYEKAEIIDVAKEEDPGKTQDQRDNPYMIGNEERKSEIEMEDVTIHFRAPIDGSYYLTEGTEDILKLQRLIVFKKTGVSVNGVFMGNFGSSAIPFNIYIGDYRAGEEAELTLTDAADYDAFYIYGMNSDSYAALSEAIGKRAGRGLAKGGSLYLSVPEGEAGEYVIPLPCSKGQTVTVDGKRAEIKPYMGALLSLDLDGAAHEIRVSYISPGFWTGLFLCGIGIFLAIFLLHRGRDIFG